MDQQTKRLIYSNIANGVSPKQVCEAFELSHHDVHIAFKEVARLVAAYQIEQAMPFHPCQSIAAARQNRGFLLEILEKLDLGETGRIKRVSSFNMKREM